MARFNSDNRRGGGGGSYRGGNRRDSGERRMFDAVCAECGKDCKVPFQASSDKPVYCSNCFEKKGDHSKGRSDRRDYGRRDTGGGDGSQKINSDAIVKLSKNIEVLNTKIDSLIHALSSLNMADKKDQKVADSSPSEEKPKANAKKVKTESKEVKTETKRSKEPKKKPTKKTSASKAKK